LGIKSVAKSIGLRIPQLGRVLRDKDRLFVERNALVAQRDDLVVERDVLVDEHAKFVAAHWVPLGHFFSSIPDLDDIRRRHKVIFNLARSSLPGLDLNEDAQLRLLDELKGFYADIPFTALRTPAFRYYFENYSYSYSDGILFHCLLRKVRPQRLIEVGSGYSSALALDTNELFLDNSVEMTFIDPFPELLRSMLRERDIDCRILDVPVQDVPLSVFDELEDGDILFIDSTHVSKVGSDVNFLYFEVLPRLRPGVYVHIHDIFDGFEYKSEWIYEGRAWNEQYLLRAFLIDNPRFEILLMNTFMERIHRGWFSEHMPDCLKNEGGSIWLRSK
jgi:hypothetical protein